MMWRERDCWFLESLVIPWAMENKGNKISEGVHGALRDRMWIDRAEEGECGTHCQSYQRC